MKLENESPATAGIYTVEISVTEGDNYTAAANITEASWTFEIKKADKANLNSIQTGDNSNLWLWCTVLFVSGIVIFGIALNGWKRKNK